KITLADDTIAANHLIGSDTRHRPLGNRIATNLLLFNSLRSLLHLARVPVAKIYVLKKPQKHRRCPVIAHPDGCRAGLGCGMPAANGTPSRIRRLASSAPMARRREVSITDRMSA